jgi:hypothetical protein
MAGREIRTVSYRRVLTVTHPADDPLTAADLAERLSQAADNDRLSNVVVGAEHPEADLVAKEEPQQTLIAARSSLRDFEVLLLVLYAAYVVAVAATVVLLLRWGFTSG